MKRYFEVMFVVCVIFLFNAVFIPITNADWSMYRSNSSRSGVGTGYIELAPTMLWKSNITWELAQTNIDFEEHTWTTPAVVNGVVYICSSSHVEFNNFHGNLWWSDAHALNSTNGAEVWDYRINSSEQISPSAVVNGVVYFGSDNNNFYALSASNGTLFWNSTIPNIGQSSPAVVDGVVYIGGYAGNVYALNAANGDIIWNSTVGDNTAWSSPAVVNGVVYISSAAFSEPGDGYPGDVYALNAKNGRQLWKSNTNGWVESSPAVANGVVYASSYDGNIYALNAATGAKLWNSHDLSSNPTSPPAVANGLVYFDSFDGNDYALDAATGAKVWNFTVGTGTGTPPIVVDGIVITVRPSGIHGLNAENGALIWTYKNVNNTYGEPAVDNGIMYFGAENDQVIALGVSPTSSPSTSPTPTASPTSSFAPGTSSLHGNTLFIIIGVVVVAVIIATVVFLTFRKVLKTKPTSPPPPRQNSTSVSTVQISKDSLAIN